MTGVPGSAAGIAAAVSTLTRAAHVVEEQSSRLAEARDVEWSGGAADAFRVRTARLRGDATDAATRLQSAAGTLSRYLDALRRQEATVSAAEHRFEERRRDVAGTPLNIGAYLDMLRAASEHRAELAELELAATRAAAELLTLSGDPGWGDSWFDPFGWVDDPAIPRREIDDDILEDGSFDPETIKQRHIGSCSLLSALASLMNSDRGDEWIRKNIRWDEAREGYWVTLYTDGVPVDVFVDHVYGQGAEQGSDGFWVFDGGEPGIASLYEAAVAQHIGYDDLNDGISGVTAMELLTGENGTYIEAPYPGQNETWTQVTDALERGDPVNTGTLTDIGGDGSWDVEVQRLDSDDNLVTDQVSIRGNHAYAIVGSEPDGSVWIMNPWGPGNGADGGGAFLVPPEVFSNLFHGVTISEIPS